MFKVIKDAIPNNFANHIEETVANLPLYWHPNTSYGPTNPNYQDAQNLKKLDTNIVDNGQFTHAILEDGKIFSQYHSMFMPLLYFFADKAEINVSSIERIRINLLVRDKTFKSNNYNFPHTDSKDTYSFLYYVNESDGDTFFFNEYGQDQLPESFTLYNRITPIKGSGVFFESERYHASSSPVNTQARYVINYNFR
jgi:hypothetical protein